MLQNEKRKNEFNKEGRLHTFDDVRRYAFPIIGIILVIAANIPFFILKGNSVVSVRDQLDGEIAVYILRAKYLFSGADYFPEYMGGVFKGALTPPSYGSLILFKLFSPLWAYILNQFLVMLTGFLGMYLWGVKLTKNRLICLICSLLFAFLPHFSVYGLSVTGIPLIMYAFYQLSERNEDEANKQVRVPRFIFLYTAIAVYGFFSSLILCGYAVCLCAVIALIVMMIKKQGKRIRMAAGIIELVVIYILLNNELIAQIVKPGSGSESHKTEMVRNSAPFFRTFFELFTRGTDSVPSLHFFIMIVSAATLVVLFGYMVAVKVAKKRKLANVIVITYELKRQIRWFVLFFLAAVMIALFYATMHWEPVVKKLSSLDGAVKAFQVERFTWLYPFIWYTTLILVGVIWFEVLKKHNIGIILWLLVTAVCSIYVLKESVIKDNAMEFVRKESTALTWDAFFSEEEFKEVAEYIKNETGQEQSEYRVGSLGMEPSISTYNGFYTIDGYSNNYELSYKHSFRRVIERELEKNAENKRYFDEWGNRCYLFSAEYYKNPLLTKYTHPSFQNLELDTDSLKELGCKYLLAAGEIVGAEEKGYRLCKIFDAPEYTYFIYLYEVL